MTEAAAEALSCDSTRQIDELRRAGKLIGRLMGREWKFHRDDLEAYVASLPTSVEAS